METEKKAAIERRKPGKALLTFPDNPPHPDCGFVEYVLKNDADFRKIRAGIGETVEFDVEPGHSYEFDLTAKYERGMFSTVKCRFVISSTEKDVNYRMSFNGYRIEIKKEDIGNNV